MHVKLLYDLVLYDKLLKNDIPIVYYVNPNRFEFKEINIHEGFYSDKKIYTSADELFNTLFNKKMNELRYL